MDKGDTLTAKVLTSKNFYYNTNTLSIGIKLQTQATVTYKGDKFSLGFILYHSDFAPLTQYEESELQGKFMQVSVHNVEYFLTDAIRTIMTCSWDNRTVVGVGILFKCDTHTTPPTTLREEIDSVLKGNGTAFYLQSVAPQKQCTARLVNEYTVLIHIDSGDLRTLQHATSILNSYFSTIPYTYVLRITGRRVAPAFTDIHGVMHIGETLGDNIIDLLSIVCWALDHPPVGCRSMRDLTYAYYIEQCQKHEHHNWAVKDFGTVGLLCKPDKRTFSIYDYY